MEFHKTEDLQTRYNVAKREVLLTTDPVPEVPVSTIRVDPLIISRRDGGLPGGTGIRISIYAVIAIQR